MMGLAIIAACVAFGVDLKSGSSLGFLIIPEMFKGIPGGHLFLVLFYGALTIAGIGAAIGGVEATLVPLVEEWGFTRRQVIPVLFIFWNLAALPCMLSKDTLDWIDTTIGSFGILLGGLFFFIFAGYCWGAKRIRENVLNLGADIQFGAWWDVCVKFIAPGLILFASYGFFQAWLIPYVAPPITWTVIIVCVVFNVVVFADALKHHVPLDIGDIPSQKKAGSANTEITN
jgi:NSS family neurotransmitter:Na+ symporter